MALGAWLVVVVVVVLGFILAEFVDEVLVVQLPLRVLDFTDGLSLEFGLELMYEPTRHFLVSLQFQRFLLLLVELIDPLNTLFIILRAALLLIRPISSLSLI